MIQEASNQRNEIAKKQMKEIIQIYYQECTQTMFFDDCQLWIETLQYMDSSKLKILIIQNCDISDHKVAARFAAIKFRSLNFLKIYNHKLNKQSFDHLMMSQLPQLQTLRLTGTNLKGHLGLNSNDIESLFNKRFDRIKNLLLDYNSLQNIMLNKMLTLQKLILNKNLLGNSGIKFLSKSNLPFLKILQIQSCQIGCEGFKHLVKSHWPLLESLKIRSNKIKLEGRINFYLSYFKNLKQYIFDELNKFNCLKILIYTCTKLEQNPTLGF